MTTTAGSSGLLVDPTALHRVVVPVDGSELAASALALARTVAARAGVEVVRFHATDAGGAGALPEADVDLQVQAPYAPDAIAAEAGRPGSLLCMSTHGRGRVAAELMGSVAEATLRRATAPLLLVGPAFDAAAVDAALHRVVVALDGSEAAERIVPAAVAWARWLGARLELVQVARPGELPTTGPTAPEPAYETVYLRRVAQALAPGADWDVLHGDDAVDALLDYADGAVIAMSTHGRSGLARVRFGSVAMAVAHRATGPLLVAGPHLA